MLPSRSDLCAGLGLTAITLVTFAQVCRYDFVDFDENVYVTENPQVQAGLSGPSLWWALRTTHFVNWHPLTWLSLQLDHELYGLNPGGYHGTNLLLHVANTLLLFLALRRMTGAVWRSAVVAALFAVHPLHVEPVAWVAERKGLLSTFFWALALLAYAGYAKRPGLGRYLAVILSFALGLMAKPMVVTLPCLLLLLDYWPLGRFRKAGDAGAGGPRAWWSANRRLVLEKLPLLCLSAASCAVTVFAMRQGGAQNRWEQVPSRVAGALAAYVGYLAKTVWPSGLAPVYPHPGPSLVWWQVAAAGLLLAGVTALALREMSRRPYLAVGWFWYLGILVPVIGLLQVLGPHLLADRYTYVPLIGLFLAATWWATEVLDRHGCPRIVQVALAVVLVAACGLGAWRQARHWRNADTLWEHAVRVTENNYTAHNNLAVLRFHQRKFREAEYHYTEAVRINPTFSASTHVTLGSLHLRRGRPAQAERCFHQALQVDPESAEAYNNLGALRLRQRRPDEAVPYLFAALRRTPDDIDVLSNLGTAFLRSGRLAEAEQRYAEVVRLTPGSAAAHHQLGRACAEQERFADAAAHYRRAVQLQPRVAHYCCDLAFALHAAGQPAAAAEHYRRAAELDPHWRAAACRAAWTYATHPEVAARDGPQALRIARQVCQATNPPQPEYLDVLAAAYAEVGRFDDAVQAARQAVSLAAGQPDRSRPIADRLRLYEQRRPYREPPRRVPAAGDLGPPDA